MTDPSKAQARTIMAWQRTALALGVLAAVDIKLAKKKKKILGSTTAIPALLGSIILCLFWRTRLAKNSGPAAILTISSLVVVLLGLATILQIM